MTNHRGQIAIFVAFIFQVLFVFFAMIINVGLLVHHKINLQNSVDLAAYYGAMKQAETLNAMAHINYQIRQSYKLLMFRYRELGTAGDIVQHPWLQVQGTFRPGASVDAPLGYPPTFCIAYAPFDFMTSTESYCQNTSGVTIPLPGKFDLVSANFLASPILSFQNSVQQAFALATQKGIDACKKASNLAYYSMARFIYGYKIEVAQRKKLMARLANELSQSEVDFKDIDGLSVKDGVRMTLEKNLTPQNKDGMGSNRFTFFNAMGAGECKGSGSELEPPSWLQEIFVFPAITVMESDCNQPITNDVKLNFRPKYINSGRPQDQPLAGNLYSPFTESIPQLMPYVQEPSSASALGKLFRTTIGYEKNPWCMAYVAVEAETTPALPFAPGGSVTLKARAFAKPFGGRLGPWHREKWSPQSRFSDQGKELDPLLPPRAMPTDTQADISTEKSRGNFSRYIGDAIGVDSKIHSGSMAKGIFASARAAPQQKLSLSWWNHLAPDGPGVDSLGNPGDTLAWDGQQNVAPGLMRNLEIMAIAPNQFDLTYYSIEPDFYRNYMHRLQKREGQFGFNILGDHGSRKNDETLKKFSVKDQIKVLAGSDMINAATSLTYFVRDPEELLTSFQSKSPKNHNLDFDRFGKCRQGFDVPEDARIDRATTGNCVEGGRTGYSVKLVDGEFLKKGDLELGGPGVTGAIKNPWDERSVSR